MAHGLFVIGDHHGAPAEHVAGAHQHRISDAPRDFAGLFHAGCRSVGRAGDAQLIEQFAEEFAILRQIDVLGVGADDRHVQLLQRDREIQRRLSAELHDHAIGLFGVIDIQHVFERKRLEV